MTPERVFLALALAFGAAFALVTPPLDAPDELRHLLRAYLLSEGRLSVPGRAPGYRALVPRSFARLHAGEAEASPGEPAPCRHSTAQTCALLDVPLEPSQRRAAGALSLYGPVAHVPGALGLGLGRLLGLPPLLLLYLGRAANLCAWAALTALAIRLTPLRKWSFVLLGLTPMSVFVASSLSADGPTNAVALLWTALALRCAYGAQRGTQVGAGGVLALASAGALLGLVKPGYQALAALALLAPTARFGTARRRRGVLVAVAAAVAIPSLLWVLSVRAADPPPSSGFTDAAGQLAFIRSHPLALLERIATTCRLQAWIYLRSCVGYLGNLDVMLPEVFYLAYPLALLGSACCDAPDPAGLGPWRRAALLGLFALLVSSVLTLAYVGWNPPGARVIHGVQGRYFAPALPLLLLALPAWRRLPRAAPLGLAVFCAAALGAALHATLQRYYPG